MGMWRYCAQNAGFLQCPRTYNCLKHAQINMVGDLLKMSECELLKMPKFGNKALEKLQPSSQSILDSK